MKKNELPALRRIFLVFIRANWLPGPEHILSCDRKKGYAGLKIEANERRKGIGAAAITMRS